MNTDEKGGWQFDDDTAARFDMEARTHIPNYERVVQKCVDIATSAFPDKSRAKIIDVGCATGYTMERLLAAGFEQVWGVDNSQSMINHCRVKERVLFSDSFPTKHAPYDLVFMNWTLHFIPEREEYLRDVKDSLSGNGILVLTDKMTSSPFIHDRYYDFKRSMGVSDQEINRKEKSIQGVLKTLPLGWYFDTLQKLGFRDISVIDANYCFATLFALK